MKKFQLIFLFIIPSFAFSQIEKKTKIYFKVKADCNCVLQFIRDDKPFGEPVPMAPKSFIVFVDKQTNGFYITCGESNTGYFKFQYQPGQYIYTLTGGMPCDKSVIDPTTTFRFAIEPDSSITPSFD
ncbi:hypothetical protein FW778_17150 [Ginsengibacter hankyongi]|uniref:Uncharacterized protein n=1 Tax=Ginsengibacter hankyongi TaxID=2607284 RepID=A0A5J5IDE3_9BACT|nr:hypothetical protein [Ginsengibacter hankyongi]KAA9037156.1 hypothetical protein FW778_17150 [Ginsengibacter hankyongi]